MRRCENCDYCWQDKRENHPPCKYADPWPAPCEYDDEKEEIEDRYTLADLGNNWW